MTGQRASWLNQRPRLESEWLWADVDGDDRQEMVILWRGLEARPELVELALLGRDEADRWQLLWQERPLARQERYRSLVLAAAGDLTGDGSQEIVLSDPASGALLVLMTGQDGPGLIDVPGRCNGAIVLRDTDDDGLMEIVRAGCPGGGRWSLHWDGQEFSAHVRR